jgi:peptidoglycan/xylan/chitin deacetylase (PgdA/CDA1 family)
MGRIPTHLKLIDHISTMVYLFLLLLYLATAKVMYEQQPFIEFSKNVNENEIDNLSNSTLYRVNVKEKLIALTFDDDPHPVYTRKIVKILDKYQAKETFFVTGQRAKSYSSTLKEVSEQGHEIGNHTYSHPSMKKNYVPASARRNPKDG